MKVVGKVYHSAKVLKAHSLPSTVLPVFTAYCSQRPDELLQPSFVNLSRGLAILSLFNLVALKTCRVQKTFAALFNASFLLGSTMSIPDIP